MLFSGAFNNLTVQQSVALLSCFVFQENADMPKLADDLSGLLRQMQVNIVLLFAIHFLKGFFVKVLEIIV